jgi:hypothetical protein
MLAFQVFQLLHQLVEFGVAEFGMVEDVVEMLVVANFLAQGLDLFLEVFQGRHRANYSQGRVGVTSDPTSR